MPWLLPASWCSTGIALADGAENPLPRANKAMNELPNAMTNQNVAIANAQTGTVRLPKNADAVKYANYHKS